jgi:protein TonB
MEVTMISKTNDWKDVANRYHEKAVALAILILLFMFLAAPKFEVKPFEIISREIIGIDLPPEIRDVVPPPNTLIKPDIKLVFDDAFNEDDPDVMIATTLEPTTLDPYDVNTNNIIGKTNKLVVFEDPPIPIKQISPVYSSMAKNVELEGIVGLEVEVFADGTVGAVEVLKSLQSGPGGLDNEAVKALKQWEFQPARSNGNPIAVWTYVEIEFSLE